MTRSSLNEVTTFRWSLDEDLQHYQAAGWEAIGLWRRKLADFGDEKAIELVRESELAVSSLSWAGGFTGSEGHSSAESIAERAPRHRTGRRVERRVPGDLFRRAEPSHPHARAAAVAKRVSNNCYRWPNTTA